MPSLRQREREVRATALQASRNLERSTREVMAAAIELMRAGRRSHDVAETTREVFSAMLERMRGDNA